jgi:hypothetical protein
MNGAGMATVHIPVPDPPSAPYADLVRRVLRHHRIRVRRWRTDMTGCAWRVDHAGGHSVNWIEAPVPRTPISLAIFLHEVGHHAIGLDRYRRRCEEEYHAWAWALARMAELGVPPDGRTLRRYELSMRYAVAKAVRRGMSDVPPPLERFSTAA